MFLFFVETAIFFYEFSKSGKIAIIKTITESQNHLKESGSSIICDVIPEHQSRAWRIASLRRKEMPNKAVLQGIALHRLRVANIVTGPLFLSVL